MLTARITIIIMVLVSIHPFALRRLLLIAAVLFGLSAACFADCLFMARQYAVRSTHGRHLQSEASPLPERLSNTPETGQQTAASTVQLEAPFRMKFALSAEPFGPCFPVVEDVPMN